MGHLDSSSEPGYASKSEWCGARKGQASGGKRSEYEKLKHHVVELEDHLGEVQQQSMKLVKWQQGPTASHFLLSILQYIYLDLVFFAGFLLLMYIYTQNHHQCMCLIWVRVITLIISVPGLLFLQNWGRFCLALESLWNFLATVRVDLLEKLLLTWETAQMNLLPSFKVR